MSFFDDVISTIFGGTDTSAQDAQAAANRAAASRIDTTSGQARSDVLSLFPQAQDARNQGFQAALDVLGQSIPAQLQTFQQGNLGAQQNLLSGLPQFTNAILGNQIDFSGLQPTAINAPTGFLQQQLPFSSASLAAGAVDPTDINSIASLLAGVPTGGGGNFSQAAPTGGGGDGGRRGLSGISTGGGTGNPLSGFGGDINADISGLLGGLNPFEETGQFAGIGSTARGIGKAAGAAGLFSPSGSVVEAISGLFELSALNDKLAELGLEDIGFTDALGAGMNPFEDLRDLATERFNAREAAAIQARVRENAARARSRPNFSGSGSRVGFSGGAQATGRGTFTAGSGREFTRSGRETQSSRNRRSASEKGGGGGVGR